MKRLEGRSIRGMKLMDLRGRKYLYKLIWLTCFCVSIPILVCGILFYQYSVRGLRTSFLEESRLELQFIGDKLDRILGSLETSSFTLATYRPITELADQVIDSSNTILWRQMLDKLVFEKNSNEYIDQVYYYNAASGILVSDSYGYVPLRRYPEKESFGNMALGSESGWTLLPDAGRTGRLSFVRPMASLPGGAGYIVMDINLSTLREVFYQNRGQYAAGSLMMALDKNGKLLFSSLPLAQFFDSPRSEEELVSSLDLSDSFDRMGGQGYYFTTRASPMGYTYVTVTQEDAILSTTPWIQVFVFFAVLLPLLLGLLLTVICALFLYRPIELLIQSGTALSSGANASPKGNEIAFLQKCFTDLKEQSDGLRRYIETVRPELRESFVFKLMKNELCTTEPSFKQKCIDNGIPVNARYVVMLVNLGKAGHDVEAAERIANDIKAMPCQITPCHTFVVLCSETVIAVAVGVEGNPPRERLVANMFAYANDTVALARTHLNKSVTIGLGRPCASFFELATSYNEALHALGYQLCQGNERILYIGDVEKWQMQSTLRYPYDLEGEIIRSLKAKNIHDACLRLDRFLHALSLANSQGFIRQSLYLFLSNIIFSFDDKESKLLEFFKRNLFDQLETFATAAEMSHWFKTEVFVLYMDLQSDVNEQSRALAVEKVCHYIADNISFEISLPHCAQLLDMSPSYFSKIFKLQTGINFMDYVIMCKIDKAKQLLAQTDKPIHEISEQVGYSERNFYRVFLKLMEMSPNEFRASSVANGVGLG